MNRFIDVTADKWFAKDVNELATFKVDGSSFYEGIPYNIFQSGKEAVDYEITNTINGKDEFFIPFNISPNANNPLVVYVDGVATAINDIVPKPSESKTYVKLRREVGNGSVVRFKYSGEPAFAVVVCFDNVKVYSSMSTGSTVLTTANIGTTFAYVERPDLGNWYKVKHDNVDGYIEISKSVVTPSGINFTNVSLPSSIIIIDSGYVYEYSPFDGTSSESVRLNGTELQRVDTVDDIKYGELQYTITDGRLYTSYHLNNEVLEVVVLEKSNNGITKPKYQKLRVQSSKIIYYNRFFPDIATNKGELIVTLSKFKRTLLQKFTDYDYLTDRPTVSRFNDVNIAISNGSPWWWDFLRDLDNLRTLDGRWVFNADKDGNLHPTAPITRAELADIVDKFRIWCIETLK